MPTLITHSFVALVAGKVFAKINSFKFWLLSILCSILPDADVVTFGFGIPYGHMFGHRGFSHSILFALLVAFIVVLIGFREIKANSKLWWMIISYFFIVGISHDILDAMTSGGLGVGFFIPFDSTRYFFLFRPIKVSPLGLAGFLSITGWRVMINEVIWVWFPALILLLLSRFIRIEGYINTRLKKISHS